MKWSDVLQVHEGNQLLRLLENVEAKEDRIVITKRVDRTARVERIETPKLRLRGTWKGLVEVKGDIVHFSNKDWERHAMLVWRRLDSKQLSRAQPHILEW